jgi:hypothetical protein
VGVLGNISSLPVRPDGEILRFLKFSVPFDRLLRGTMSADFVSDGWMTAARRGLAFDVTEAVFLAAHPAPQVEG